MCEEDVRKMQLGAKSLWTELCVSEFHVKTLTLSVTIPNDSLFLEITKFK